jgi:hypothetical protein
MASEADENQQGHRDLSKGVICIRNTLHLATWRSVIWVHEGIQ